MHFKHYENPYSGLAQYVNCAAANSRRWRGNVWCLLRNTQALNRNLNPDIKRQGVTWTAFAFLAMFLRSALLLCETVLNEQLQSQPEAKQIVWSLCWRPISLRPNKAWKCRHFQQQCSHKWANLFHIKGGRLHLIMSFDIWRKILLWQLLEKERTINEHDN